ncbi:hypothetical protein [uncultured Xylophilus sp.]|uniref:hypothetical protein n=1 Tax=uncultured Xylophilus sp. TaxID=296832 RepID=UPI0025EAAEF9|nr:hypothetical protein [uncultured Xylophilus sp.]
MHPVAAFDHLLNFVAPALVLGMLVAAVSRFLTPKTAAAPGWTARAAINSIVGVVVLAGGLAVTGHDGRMATWALLVAAVATSEWCLRRGWKA